ncbi:MAG: DUF4365 domain-containing protein [Bdellovibrionales bacterium]
MGIVEMIHKYDWARLNHIQIGKYTEYLVKMEFTLFGFDVYTSEVDDHGIDLVIRVDDGRYYDVQVKSIRNLNYIFFPKDKFRIRKNLIAVIAIYKNGYLPSLYIIPSKIWLKPNTLFVSRDYEGLKSKPEWGINLSVKNLQFLEGYEFEKMVTKL